LQAFKQNKFINHEIAYLRYYEKVRDFEYEEINEGEMDNFIELGKIIK